MRLRYEPYVILGKVRLDIVSEIGPVVKLVRDPVADHLSIGDLPQFGYQDCLLILSDQFGTYPIESALAFFPKTTVISCRGPENLR